jgi:hypothetical protein
MSDDKSDGRRNYSKQLAAEYRALSDPIVKAQMQLDAWWQSKLDARARARRSEIPETGEYSPIARLERELDDVEEAAGWRYRRGR